MPRSSASGTRTKSTQRAGEAKTSDSAGMNNAPHPLHWYTSIPVVSRLYLTSAVVLALATSTDMVRPLSLYYSPSLVFAKGEVWRIVTNFLYFGDIGIDFVFHMYFLVRYTRMLEEGEFRGKTADFLWMLIIGVGIMLGIQPFFHIKFLSSSLTFMMVYLWGRRNSAQRMAFLGIIPFNAPYLPWVLLIFSMLLGHSLSSDIVGIVAGHIYYFLQYVYPVVAEVRGWRIKRVIQPPSLLVYACGGQPVQYAPHVE